MKLTPMRYKNYTWPHNPRTYTIEYERKVALHKVPCGRYHLQDLGLTRRIMRGEGEFTGKGAYDEFKRLANVFYSDGPGVLVHPVWMTTSAYFVGLSLKQEPREDYVSYTFTFWEESGSCETVAEVVRNTSASAGSTGTGGQSASQARYYTVVTGDTMWGISRKYGMTLAALIALNPQIPNPNLIYTGQKVRIA